MDYCPTRSGSSRRPSFSHSRTPGKSARGLHTGCFVFKFFIFLIIGFLGHTL